MNKKILCITCMIICLGAPINVFAVDEDVNTEYSYDVEKEISDDILQEAVDEVIENDDKISEEEKIGSDEGEDDFRIDEYDIDNSYIEYSLVDFPITSYFNKNSFKDVISNNYKIIVPYTTEDGEQALLFYVNQDDVLVLLEEQIIGADSYRYIAKEDINHLIQSQISDAKIQNITYTYSERYFLTLIYVETNKGEYLIPYAKDGELNLDNGTVYTTKELFNKLNTLFDESLLNNSKLSGGLPYREQSVGKYIIGAMCSAIGAIICAILFFKKCIKKGEKCPR